MRWVLQSLQSAIQFSSRLLETGHWVYPIVHPVIYVQDDKSCGESLTDHNLREGDDPFARVSPCVDPTSITSRVNYSK